MIGQTDSFLEAQEGQTGAVVQRLRGPQSRVHLLFPSRGPSCNTLQTLVRAAWVKGHRQRVLRFRAEGLSSLASPELDAGAYADTVAWHAFVQSI